MAESLFKHLYELVADRLVWSPKLDQDPQPISLERGALIEVEVELAPDPIYGFNATMGVLTDIADDYPALFDDKATALIIAEAELVTKVLERLLVGLIPLKAEVCDLSAGEVGGVGVTEQAKYWRDVRRVLFSKSKFTVLGRISRTGVQPSWTPVKLTEVMRDIAPQFPDMITRVGRVGYSAPINAREDKIKEFARSQRTQADTLTQQGSAFDALLEWMVRSEILSTEPENMRTLKNRAREASGLKASSAVTSIADFVNPNPPEEPAPEALIDLEIIAIYW